MRQVCEDLGLGSVTGCVVLVKRGIGELDHRHRAAGEQSDSNQPLRLVRQGVQRGDGF